MYNETMLALGQAPSAIRELFAYGARRKAEIGTDAVFDFSIGNPSVPTPQAVTRAIAEATQDDPVKVHAYTQSPGDPVARQVVADSLNRRFGTSYTAQNLYLSCGAAASISMTLKALIELGDEIAVIAPFFPEYRVWVETHGATLTVIPACSSDFQLDFKALEQAITSRTKALIINTPNNPVGVVYPRASLERLADLLRQKSLEAGHPIFLISDEPYRELVYGGLEVAWVPSLYDDTIVCYSWSKSLSLPGERIGFVLVPPAAHESRQIMAAVSGAGRALGFICAPALFQRVIAACVYEPAQTAIYEENRRLLTDMLDELGFEYVNPDGAFYLWVRALEADAQAFSDRARTHELLLVPSDSFGAHGWVRLSYCIDAQAIKNSKDAFAALMADYR